MRSDEGVWTKRTIKLIEESRHPEHLSVLFSSEHSSTSLQTKTHCNVDVDWCSDALKCDCDMWTEHTPEQSFLWWMDVNQLNVVTLFFFSFGAKRRHLMAFSGLPMPVPFDSQPPCVSKFDVYLWKAWFRFFYLFSKYLFRDSFLAEIL